MVRQKKLQLFLTILLLSPCSVCRPEGYFAGLINRLFSPKITYKHLPKTEQNSKLSKNPIKTINLYNDILQNIAIAPENTSSLDSYFKLINEIEKQLIYLLEVSETNNLSQTIIWSGYASDNENAIVSITLESYANKLVYLLLTLCAIEPSMKESHPTCNSFKEKIASCNKTISRIEEKIKNKNSVMIVTNKESGKQKVVPIPLENE